METTINEYSFNKLQKDISKFMRHSEKVLKIDAIGQIIVADWFAKNIEKFNNIKDNYNHLITLIEMDSLKYLEKFKDKNDLEIKLLNFLNQKLITKDMIKSTF